MNIQPQQLLSESKPEITVQTNEHEFVFPHSLKQGTRMRSSVYLTQAFQHLDHPDSPREFEYERKLRSKSVGRKPETHIRRKMRLFSGIDVPEKNRIQIIFETPRKKLSTEKYEEEDKENQVKTIDLSRTIRENREKEYDNGGVSIMATALTAAALSGNLLVRGFKAFFT